MARKSDPDQFVLDGSLALAWYFKDEANAYAEAVLAAFPDAQAAVPAIWHLEVGNALLMGERRKRSTEAQAATFLTFLRSLPIIIDDETAARAWSETMSLARAHELTTYDAAYLELALRCNLPLASLDDKLNDAAQAVGVAKYRP